MSKNNNVNPGQYKEAGRERQGDAVLHEVNKQQYTQSKKAEENNSQIPNQDQPENQVPGSGGKNNAGNATASANSSSGDS